MKTLRGLFLKELAKVYDGEKQILMALPAMSQSATNEGLVAAFELHLDQTKEHVQRLERVAELLSEDINGGTNSTIKAAIAESEETAAEGENVDAADAALIAKAQIIEHIEIASYGALLSWLDEMDHKEVKDLLGNTLDEEKATDQKLIHLAQGGIFKKGINEQAN